MNKKDLFKNIIEQNSINKDDILASVLTKAQTQTVTIKEKRGINFKRIVKYTLPAALVLAIVFGSVFTVPRLVNNSVNPPTNSDANSISATESPKSGNWFSLSAYAADDMSQSKNVGHDVELQKNVAIKLPSGYSSSGTKFFRDGTIWTSNLQPFKLTIEGDNIKSVCFTDENNGIGITENNLYSAEISEDILPHENVVIGKIDGSNYINIQKLKEYWDSGVLDDIKEKCFKDIKNNLDNYFWICFQTKEDKTKGVWELYAIYGNDDGRLAELPPTNSIRLIKEDANQTTFICSIMRWLSFGKITMDEAYKQGNGISREIYINDRIKVTVTFDDGEVSTQILGLTINKNTVETSLQIIDG
ncbi:MAG: hypothetical protein FWD71_17805 [Oscillospiraceae bacterium]|nr:hypothetical protein [Oscillospiraceae bacterium]